MHIETCQGNLRGSSSEKTGNTPILAIKPLDLPAGQVVFYIMQTLAMHV